MDIHIYGAGLAGMTAAIALAREGIRAVVHDEQKNVGGSPALHPSVHTTPAQLDELVDYTGIDLRNDFIRTDPYPTFYYGKKLLLFPPYARHNTAYCVERGPRATSIDNHLFAIACDEGVDFEFGVKIDLSKVPPRTIVATGLSPELYERLNIPCTMIHGRWTHREIEDQRATGNIFMGPFTTEYGYTAQVNGLDYNLLFSRYPLTRQDEAAYKEILVFLGREPYPEPWRSVTMAVPADVRLFSGDMICAGTLSGMIEPFWGYGIVGAIISGRLAAKAVMARDEAEADFARFTRGFHAKHVRREKFAAHSHRVRELLIKAALLQGRLACLFDRKRAQRPREPLRWFRWEPGRKETLQRFRNRRDSEGGMGYYSHDGSTGE